MKKTNSRKSRPTGRPVRTKKLVTRSRANALQGALRALKKLPAPTRSRAQGQLQQSLRRLQLDVLAEFFALEILSVDPCFYSDDLGGWIQPTPPPVDQSTVTVRFRLTDKSLHETSGRVRGYIDGVELLSWGGEAQIDSLQPGSSVEGRLWFYARSSSINVRTLHITYETADGPVVYDPSSGKPSVLPHVVTEQKFPYVAADADHLPSALISALNITPLYDNEGRLTAASAVDRFGVHRTIRISFIVNAHAEQDRNVPSITHVDVSVEGGLTYSETPTDGKTRTYDNNPILDLPYPDEPGRLFSAALKIAFDSRGKELMRFNARVLGFPKGSELKGGATSASSRNLSFEGALDPIWKPDGREYYLAADARIKLSGASDQNAKLSGTYDWTDNHYSGDDFNVYNYFPDETARVSYFAPLIQEESVMGAILKDPSNGTRGPIAAMVTQYLFNAAPQARRAPGRSSSKARSGSRTSSYRTARDERENDPWYHSPWFKASVVTGLTGVRTVACSTPAKLLNFLHPAGSTVACGLGWAVFFVGTAGALALDKYAPPKLPEGMPPYPAGKQSPGGGYRVPASSPDQPVHDPYNPPPGPIGSDSCPPGYYRVFGSCWPIGTSPGDLIDL